MTPTLPAAVRQVLAQLPSDECVLWPGALSRDGYGRHRLVFETLRGPVPDGLVLDHLCRVRACCNDRHLEPVTLRENVRRGVLARLGRVRSGLGWPDDRPRGRVVPVNGRRKSGTGWPS